jgi:hypothetical protein
VAPSKLELTGRLPVGPSLTGVISGGPNPPDGIDHKLPDSMLYGLSDGSAVNLNVEGPLRHRCNG